MHFSSRQNRFSSIQSRGTVILCFSPPIDIYIYIYAFYPKLSIRVSSPARGRATDFSGHAEKCTCFLVRLVRYVSPCFPSFRKQSLFIRHDKENFNGESATNSSRIQILIRSRCLDRKQQRCNPLVMGSLHTHVDNPLMCGERRGRIVRSCCVEIELVNCINRIT